MLNPVLRKEIVDPLVRLAYDSKIRSISHVIRQEVKTNIKAVRDRFKVRATDDLQNKAFKYRDPATWRQSDKSDKQSGCGRQLLNGNNAYKEWCKTQESIIWETKGVPEDFKGQWRSVEFELIFHSKEALFTFVREARNKGLHKQITIKDDGSLRPDENNPGIGKEVIVSYCANSTDDKLPSEQIVHKICDILKPLAYVNNSCGTHVHFDMRNLDEKIARQYGKRLARCVPALRSLLPKSRRNSKYCQPPINELHNSYKSSNSRYAFVNMEAFEKYKTIEVRGHSATLRADKILNWIKLCEKIMLSRIRTKNEEILSADEIIKVYKLEDDLAKYVRERYSKFNTSTNLALPHIEPNHGAQPHGWAQVGAVHHAGAVPHNG